MSTITYAFEIGQPVRIIELEPTRGTVIGLWTGRRGNEIQCRYCYNGEFKEVYFLESELQTV